MKKQDVKYHIHFYLESVRISKKKGEIKCAKKLIIVNLGGGRSKHDFFSFLYFFYFLIYRDSFIRK